MIEQVVDLHLSFYNEIQNNGVEQRLQAKGISILQGFLKNVSRVREFYQTYYSQTESPIVLCGICPGRFGSGRDGLPMLDEKTLSTMLSSVNGEQTEKTSQFINSVIHTVSGGAEEFFKQVYLTNISWYGFTKGGRNLNYYQLEQKYIKKFISSFSDEMNVIKPRIIIPLSIKVEQHLRGLKKEGLMNFEIGERLWHPYYCTFPSRYDRALSRYVSTIQRYMD